MQGDGRPADRHASSPDRKRDAPRHRFTRLSRICQSLLRPARPQRHLSCRPRSFRLPRLRFVSRLGLADIALPSHLALKPQACPRKGVQTRSSARRAGCLSNVWHLHHRHRRTHPPAVLLRRHRRPPACRSALARHHGSGLEQTIRLETARLSMKEV